MKPVHVWHDEAMAAHRPGPGHPERPERLVAAAAGLRDHPGVRWESPELATAAQLAGVHAPAYVQAVLDTRGTPVRFDEDTATSAGSVDAALLAAGAAIAAARHAVGGGRGLALVRPPGHHAEGSRAMGFCLFNNIAVAAQHARDHLGVERVLVVDWDVHHGNGTQHIFEERPDVLFFSTHQGPGFYPGTGAAHETGRGAGAGTTCNVPLQAGAGDAEILAAFDDVLRPAADRFRPQLVLVSAGFDAHADDPLAGLRVTDAGFAALCARVRAIAEDHAGGGLALVLEGGYDLGVLGRCVRACVDVMQVSPDRSS